MYVYTHMQSKRADTVQIVIVIVIVIVCHAMPEVLASFLCMYIGTYIE